MMLLTLIKRMSEFLKCAFQNCGVFHSYSSIQKIQMVLHSGDLCTVQSQYFHVYSSAHSSKINVCAAERKRKLTDVCECKQVVWKQKWCAMLSVAFQRVLWKFDNSGVLVSYSSVSERGGCLLQESCLSAIPTSKLTY